MQNPQHRVQLPKMAIFLLLGFLPSLTYQPGWASLYSPNKQHTEKSPVVSNSKISLLNSLRIHCRFAAAFFQLTCARGPKLEHWQLLWQRKKREKCCWLLKLLPRSHASHWPIFHWQTQIIWPPCLTRWKHVTALKKRSNEEKGIFGEQRYHQLYYY